WRLPILYRAAVMGGWFARMRKRIEHARPQPITHQFRRQAGISVVIPSRNGKRLLGAALPGVERELRGIPSEIIIVDNGSSDGTAASFPNAVVVVTPE